MYKSFMYTPDCIKFPGTLILYRAEANRPVIVSSLTSVLNRVGIACNVFCVFTLTINKTKLSLV